MKFGQSHILVTADLAIYSKAQQSLWDKSEILDRKLTMRLGEMHLSMAFIAAIGKLFGDGGLLGPFDRHWNLCRSDCQTNVAG